MAKLAIQTHPEDVMQQVQPILLIFIVGKILREVNFAVGMQGEE